MDFSQVMKIYNIFHSNLFQKVSTEPLIGQVNELASPIIINYEEE